MDTLLIDYGVRDDADEDLDDETKKLNVGARDMLISSVSDMTRRSPGGAPGHRDQLPRRPQSATAY